MKLRRITTHGNWIPEIDGLRFVAIVATLLVHILGETVIRGGHTFSARAEALVPDLIDRGGRGVLLFFAISGFILAQPFLRQHLLHGQAVSIWAFFKRRLTRLEPPYILSLLFYMVALAIYQHHLGSLILPLLAHIVYLHNFTSLAALNFVAWSLEVEVQFYLLAPVLGYLYAISSTVVRRGVMISLIVASATSLPKRRMRQGNSVCWSRAKWHDSHTPFTPFMFRFSFFLRLSRSAIHAGFQGH
jgi:peptidoglycan/LPS O-acetylase OafA/YrhL